MSIHSVKTLDDKPDMRPWGVTRMAAYSTATDTGYMTVEIDPITQVGVARDAEGNIQPITADTTRKRTRDGTNLDGRNDDDHLDDRR